jgi:membrane protein DedA with SNARE-associated domain
MLGLAAIIGVSSSLGYVLPAIIGLESMGIPSPGETALVLAAVLASQGHLNIVLVIVIGCASAIVGDNLGYLLGRRFGREVLAGPGPFRHRRVEVIAAGDRFFAKHGPKAVFLARWIALVRFAAAWLAGINRMPFRQFFFWNALGGITWGITFGLVGYFAGSAAANAITTFGIYGLIALVVLIIALLVLSRVRERRARRRLEEPMEGEAQATEDETQATEDEAQATEDDGRSGVEAQARSAPADSDASAVEAQTPSDAGALRANAAARRPDR